jgi:hypothetical protein
VYTGQFKKKVTLSHVYNEVTSEPTVTWYTILQDTERLLLWSRHFATLSPLAAAARNTFPCQLRTNFESFPNNCCISRDCSLTGFFIVSMWKCYLLFNFPVLWSCWFDWNNSNPIPYRKHGVESAAFADHQQGSTHVPDPVYIIKPYLVGDSHARLRTPIQFLSLTGNYWFNRPLYRPLGQFCIRVTKSGENVRLAQCNASPCRIFTAC